MHSPQVFPQSRGMVAIYLKSSCPTSEECPQIAGMPEVVSCRQSPIPAKICPLGKICLFGVSTRWHKSFLVSGFLRDQSM